MRSLLILFFCFFLSNSVFAQYYTGQRVFSNKFPYETKDYKMETSIKIKNTSGDIIVAVENIYQNKVIQHAYIKAYDTYTFTNIPYGTYVCKYMWTDRYGKKHYEKDNSSMEFSYTTTGDAGGYVITLQESINGNLSQSSISEEDFFE